MSDSQIRAALHEYTADPPGPLADGASMLAVARRCRRVRTLTTAGTAATLAAIPAVIAASIALTAGIAVVPDRSGNPESLRLTTPAITSCAGPRPTTPLTPGEPIPADLAGWARNTVTCDLKTALPRLLPQATYEPVVGAPAGPLEGFLSPNAWTDRAGVTPGSLPLNHQVDAASIIRDGQGAGDIWVTVRMTSAADKETMINKCRRGGSGCTVRHGPHGATVLVYPAVPDPRFFSQNEVIVYRANTTIRIAATDTDRRSSSTGGVQVRGAQVPRWAGFFVAPVDRPRDLVADPKQERLGRTARDRSFTDECGMRGRSGDHDCLLSSQDVSGDLKLRFGVL